MTQRRQLDHRASGRFRRLRQIRRLIRRTTLLGGLLVAGSVGYVRVQAQGHCYTEWDVPDTEVGIVLGAQVYPDGRPSRFLARRLDLAWRLLASGKIKRVIVSGDAGAAEYDEPQAMRDYLINRGVSAEIIATDGGGLDTYDSALRALRLFGVREAIVITQAYHLPRAVATFRGVGIDARGVGDRSIEISSPNLRRAIIREQFACVKTILDLVRRRDPARGPDATS